MENRDLALRIAFSWLGKPYIWGGDDPAGFDCSGLVVEILQATGSIPHRSDYTAHGLYGLFKDHTITEPIPGSLVFWFSQSIATHVEIAVDSTRSIGASGSGKPQYDLKFETIRLMNHFPVVIEYLSEKNNLLDFIINEVLKYREWTSRNGYIKVRPIFDRGDHRSIQICDPFYTED